MFQSRLKKPPLPGRQGPSGFAHGLMPGTAATVAVPRAAHDEASRTKTGPVALVCRLATGRRRARRRALKPDRPHACSSACAQPCQVTSRMLRATCATTNACRTAAGGLTVLQRRNETLDPWIAGARPDNAQQPEQRRSKGITVSSARSTSTVNGSTGNRETRSDVIPRASGARRLLPHEQQNVRSASAARAARVLRLWSNARPSCSGGVSARDAGDVGATDHQDRRNDRDQQDQERDDRPIARDR